MSIRESSSFLTWGKLELQRPGRDAAVFVNSVGWGMSGWAFCMSEVVCCGWRTGLTHLLPAGLHQGPAHRQTACSCPAAGTRAHEIRGATNSSVPAHGGEAVSELVGRSARGLVPEGWLVLLGCLRHSGKHGVACGVHIQPVRHIVEWGDKLSRSGFLVSVESLNTTYINVLLNH